MHFALMVFGPSNDEELADALAPFDENLDVEPYFVPLSDSELESAADWMGTTVENLTPIAVGDYYCDNPAAGALADGQLGYMSTRNPDGKWDYWRVGGRYAGRLKLKDGAVGEIADLSWEWNHSDERPLPGYVDRCQIRDLDIEGKRIEAALEADLEYDRLVTEDSRWVHGLSREQYVARVAAETWSCYATLIPGEGFHEAESWDRDFTPEEREQMRQRFTAKVNMLLENLDPDTWVTIVDYHS